MIALAVIALGAGMVTRADRDTEVANAPARAPRVETPQRCPAAAVRTVRLPTVVAVDEIRVVVDDRSPHAGAASVRVAAGSFDRVVRVRGAASKAVSFSPALQGAEFDVVVDPVFTAVTGSCIERIELRHGGLPIAVVRP